MHARDMPVQHGDEMMTSQQDNTQQENEHQQEGSTEVTPQARAMTAQQVNEGGGWQRWRRDFKPRPQSAAARLEGNHRFKVFSEVAAEHNNISADGEPSAPASGR